MTEYEKNSLHYLNSIDGKLAALLAESKRLQNALTNLVPTQAAPVSRPSIPPVVNPMEAPTTRSSRSY